MTDYVSIRDLSVSAVIGAHDWERAIEQTLVFSVDMVPAMAGLRQAAATDDLADALDYSAVATAIVAVVREGKFRLIETAAERVAERLLAGFPVAWLRLELRKPITTDGYTAAVTIERTHELFDHEDLYPKKRAKSLRDHGAPVSAARSPHSASGISSDK